MTEASAILEIDGKRIRTEGLLGASISTTSSLPRTAVIMLLGLVMPIVAMVVVAGPMRGSIEWGMAFGPIALVATAVPGILAALVGLYWKRDIAVIGETDKQFKALTTCGDQAQAERIVDAINQRVGNV